MNYGANIKNLRLARNMTQSQLADVAGVTRPFITQIERGTKAVTLQLAIDIADALQCKLSDIIGREV